MSRSELIVLKFGGSVLKDETALATAVHELYRWVRSGTRVVAVVSAFEGTTDALIRKSLAFTDAPSEGAQALLLATGELTTAALLGLALDRAGIPNRVLPPAAVGLRTRGSVTDSSCVSIDVDAMKRHLAEVPVAVVPGFIGLAHDGTITLLGRGGSDLSALFLADQLEADRCRLIKDVGGLFERDPKVAHPDGPAGRFDSLSWNDALTLDGKIVQHKAVRYAQDREVTFEIGGFLSPRVSRIGNAQHSLREVPQASSPLRVAVLGCGSVGRGLIEHLAERPDSFNISAILVRDINRHTGLPVPPGTLTTDADAEGIANADIVVELIGGIDLPYSLVRKALNAGSHVVTANKALIAAHGPELTALAAAQGVSLHYSAAVGGGVPMIEAVRRVAQDDTITDIRGIVNGTCNFVLDRVAAGLSFDGAVKEAQDAGFAEANPSRDLDGIDAAEKLIVLAREAWGVSLTLKDVSLESLNAAACGKAGPGQVVRQLSSLSRIGGTIRAAVSLEPVDRESPLGRNTGPSNILTIRGQKLAPITVRGLGAGRWPTSESVFA
ncbi:MAG: homoserine dehydrogenase, partial [bacterium]|nr:homoserine dehydrogenase [bacterium]